MNIIYTLEDISLPAERHVTIGNFDGMHIGHKRLIQDMLAAARAASRPGIVTTFSPHPMEVLARDKAFQRIESDAEKFALMEQIGVETLLVLPFTPEFAAMPPENFIRETLYGQLGMRHLFVGHDWTFGRAAEGDFSLVERMAAELGFSVTRLAPVMIENEIVSSSRIRELVRAGNIRLANAMLERHFTVSGEVVKGFQRGRTIGFPTANLNPGDRLLPRVGGYITYAEVEGRMYGAMTNIGNNPTFGNAHVTVETYILDFDADIYGKTIRLHFVDFLSEERKFDGVDALKSHLRQVERDVRARLGMTVSSF